jgi:hypothetical protein
LRRRRGEARQAWISLSFLTACVEPRCTRVSWPASIPSPCSSLVTILLLVRYRHFRSLRLPVLASPTVCHGHWPRYQKLLRVQSFCNVHKLRHTTSTGSIILRTSKIRAGASVHHQVVQVPVSAQILTHASAPISGFISLVATLSTLSRGLLRCSPFLSF